VQRSLTRWSRLLAALAALIAAVTASLPWRPPGLVLFWPILEDAFYSFAVARNLGLGQGLSADRHDPTNGFQPLFTVLSAPLFTFAGADRELPVRLVLVLAWLLYLVTAFLLGQIAVAIAMQQLPSRPWVFWSTAFLYLANPLVFQAHFNGLETGCALFFYALVWRYAQGRRLDTVAEQLTLGLLLGLAVLARVDAVFFVAAVCAWLWRRSRGEPAPGGGPFQVGLMAALVSSPWWLYNRLVFGSFMPSSGAAQQMWAFSPVRIGAALLSFVRTVTPWWERFDPGRFDQAPAADLIRVGLFALGACWLWRQRPAFRSALAPSEGEAGARLAMTWPGLCLLASTLALLVFYTASSFAFWFYGRYLSPLLLIATLLLGRLLGSLASRQPFAAAVVALGLAWPVPFATLASHRVPIEKGNVMYTDQLSLVSDRVPPGECVGALQSGTLGYFRDCVLNLDGKINLDALRRRREIWSYLDERKVRWLCDWPSLFRFYFGSRPDENGWEAVATRNKFVLYRRREPRS
jgi:hypothetical protein